MAKPQLLPASKGMIFTMGGRWDQGLLFIFIKELFLVLLLWKAWPSSLYSQSTAVKLMNSPSSAERCEGSAEPPGQTLQPRPAAHLAPPSTPGSYHPLMHSTAGCGFHAWHQAASEPIAKEPSSGWGGCQHCCPHAQQPAGPHPARQGEQQAHGCARREMSLGVQGWILVLPVVIFELWYL